MGKKEGRADGAPWMGEERPFLARPSVKVTRLPAAPGIQVQQGRREGPVFSSTRAVDIAGHRLQRPRVGGLSSNRSFLQLARAARR
jgi:hypothetical protein